MHHSVARFHWLKTIIESAQRKLKSHIVYFSLRWCNGMQWKSYTACYLNVHFCASNAQQSLWQCPQCGLLLSILIEAAWYIISVMCVHLSRRWLSKVFMQKVHICTHSISPGNTGQVRIWRSSARSQGQRSKKIQIKSVFPQSSFGNNTGSVNTELWSLCTLCSVGFSDMSDRMACPPSLSCDRKWARVTKCTHSRVVGLRLEHSLVAFVFCGYSCYCVSVCKGKRRCTWLDSVCRLLLSWVGLGSDRQMTTSWWYQEH